MLGGPWGIEDASCPNRENPPVPTWHASAKYRFQAGLADDMIGYEKPAWSFLYDTPGTFTPTDGCTSDPHDHSHGLEDEAVGPTAGNMVAQNLSDLLDQTPDPTAEIRLGRYVKADGTLTDAYTAPLDQGAPGHFPTDAVAIWLAAPGSTTLDPVPGHPDSGTLVALGNVRSFGDRRVDSNGTFMDFDGAEEPGGPDVSTRGMLVKAFDGSVQQRYYVNVYPALSSRVRSVRPARTCTRVRRRRHRYTCRWCPPSGSAPARTASMPARCPGPRATRPGSSHRTSPSARPTPTGARRRAPGSCAPWSCPAIRTRRRTMPTSA